MASVLLMLAGPTELDTQSIKIKKKQIKGVTRGEGDIIYIFGYCNLRLQYDANWGALLYWLGDFCIFLLRFACRI
ncbi:hypothetical protein [Enterobacter sp.]|uniref:hypothetical protein n=1 Tax=Enterobacter sp. TaxID=42895 RepID=UPI00296E4EAD|nr:hypothetical protein [Enterobacter sp.]